MERLETRYSDTLAEFESRKAAAIDRMMKMTLEQVYEKGMAATEDIEGIKACAARAMTLKEDISIYKHIKKDEVDG